MTLQTTIMPRGRIYYFRIRIPASLIILTHRKELRRSLGTSCPDEARLRGARLLSAARQMFAKLRDTPMITPEFAEIIIKDFYQIELYRRMGSVGLQGATFEQTVDWREWYDDACQFNLQSGDYIFAKEHLPAVKERFKLETTEGSAEEGLLLRLITDALLELNRADISFDNGNATYVSSRNPFSGLGPKHPATPVQNIDALNHMDHSNDPIASPTSNHSAGSQRSASNERRTRTPLALMNEFIKERNPTAETAEEYRRALMLFEGLGGNKPVAELTHNDMTQFVRHLLDLPTNYKKRLKVDDPLKAIALNKARGDRAFSTLQHKTINEKYITFVSTFLNWAKRQRLTSEDLTTDLRVRSGRKGAKQKGRLPFSHAQLKTIFATPLFHGCLSHDRIHDQGKTLVRDWRFWLPLMGLFTGCRMNEIGQLLLADVLDSDEAKNFPHIHVRLALDGEVEEGERNSLKSDASVRFVPLHPKLIELGFLDYVQVCRDAGHKRLFPDWTAGKTGKYSNPGSKWASRFLLKSRVKTSQHTFHSFRHTLIDALRLSGVEAEYRYRIMGHTEDLKVDFREIAFNLIPSETFCAPPMRARIKKSDR